MQYPYNDDNMIFNYVTHRYVLTEKGVRAYAAVSLGESFKSDVANSITAFLNLASQQTYNIIHSYNVNTEVQDYIIATTKSGREMIQEAMINRLLFLLTERKIFDEAFYSVITRILPEINTSICYSGQVFRLDKPIKWEELDGEKESESSLVLIDKTITANGLYTADDEGYDGYRSVYVNVPTDGVPRLQSKTARASNTQQVITYDTGYDGLRQVTIEAILGTYSISSNGEYDIAQYGRVNVNVSLNLQTTKRVSVSGNGIYTYTADSRYNGLQQIVVDVDVPLLLQDKTVTITQNNTTEIITKDSGYNGLGTVSVVVNVPKDTKLKGVIDGSITETITSADLAGLTRVRAYVFYKCKPTNGFSIELPNTIASDTASDGSVGIGAYAFAESNLTSIKVENNGYFLPILNHAFYKCTMLTTVDLGDSPFNFTTIGNNGHTHLFAECGTITNFIIRYPTDPLPPDFDNKANSNFENTTITNLYVPSEWVQAYTNVWKTQFGIAVNVLSLDEYNG